MSVEEQQQQEPNALPWDQDFCKVDNTTLFELIMVIILSLSLSFSLNCIKANRHNLISLCWYSNRFYYLLSFLSSFSPLQQRHLNNNIISHLNIISISSQHHPIATPRRRTTTTCVRWWSWRATPSRWWSKGRTRNRSEHSSTSRMTSQRKRKKLSERRTNGARDCKVNGINCICSVAGNLEKRALNLSASPFIELSCGFFWN